MMITRRTLSLGAAAAALAACNQQGASTGSAENHVNVYSSRHYETDRTLYAAFEQQTGIAVRVLPAAGDQLLERLRVEGDMTEADLIVTADAGNLWRLNDAGFLQNVTTPALEAGVPERLRDPNGAWWGFAKRNRIIAYRKDAVSPGDVDSMDKLTDEKFRGQIVARSSSNVYNLSLLAARIEREGAENAREWARGVRANFARDPQGGDTEQIRAIAAGEARVSIVNHYYYVRMMKSEAPEDRAAIAEVGIIFPDQAGAGAHVNISGGGVSAYSQRKDNAVRLLEFLVSDETQRMLAPLNVEFPIRPDIPPAPELATFGTFREEEVPLDALGRNQAEAARIFEEVGWR